MIVDFDKVIDDFLKKEYTPKGQGKYFPSEAGLCLRKIWYSYKFPAQIEPDLLKIFEMGNIVHDFIVQVLKSDKISDIKLLKSEFPFKVKVEDFEISGRVDNLIMVQASGKIYLVEVKSVKDLKYIKEASPHNIVQLQLYMHFVGVHNGILLYIDKSNLKTKGFEIQYNEKEALRIIERFKTLHEHLKNNELPEAEARVHKELGWMCKLCEYRDECQTQTKIPKHEND